MYSSPTVQYLPESIDVPCKLQLVHSKFIEQVIQSEHQVYENCAELMMLAIATHEAQDLQELCEPK